MNLTVDQFTGPVVMPVAAARPADVAGAELRSRFPAR